MSRSQFSSKSTMMPTTEVAVPTSRAPFQAHQVHLNAKYTTAMHTYCFWRQSPTNTLVCSWRHPAETKLHAGKAQCRSGSKACPPGLPPCLSVWQQLTLLAPFPVTPSCLTLRLHQVSRLLDCEIALFFFFFHLCLLEELWNWHREEARGCASLGKSCACSPSLADGNASLQQCRGTEVAAVASPPWTLA